MDPVLAEIYSTVLEAAPYVITAYALIWVIMFVFVMVTYTGMRKTRRELAALEEELDRRGK
ncbi:MAG: hypothetical protein FWH40_06100 [Coriobacteriia bacterium]|nr:hypothetical protein [Coriobacteriia bacterium]MCL2137073.1 hypothetical protein [Coriobacteriia bacterium]